jgi:hypothetical protein
MDNQRSLFKKFFKTPDSSSPAPPGFNPPKFQFNKKKIASIGERLKSDNAPQQDTQEETEEVVHNSSTNNTEQLDNDFIWPGEESIPEAPVQVVHQTSVQFEDSLKSKSKSASAIYSESVHKNQVKFNLSYQLGNFTSEIESLLQACLNQRNAMELAVLGIDEKIGKTSFLI